MCKNSKKPLLWAVSCVLFLKKIRLYLRMCEFCSNFVANFEK